jgi:hypothetical protein
VNQH